jgi:hypothetical protein
MLLSVQYCYNYCAETSTSCKPLLEHPNTPATPHTFMRHPCHALTQGSIYNLSCSALAQGSIYQPGRKRPVLEVHCMQRVQHLVGLLYRGLLGANCGAPSTHVMP